MLNMQLVELENGDELDLHFADQHDLPFMIAKGQAGIRSKLLGKIAGLYVLDRAISRINSDIRAVNSDLKYKDAEKNNLQYILDDWPTLWYELELIDTLAEQIHIVKAMIDKYSQVSRIYQKLQLIQSNATNIQNIMTSIPDITVDFDDIKAKITLLNRFNLIHTKLQEISIKASKIDETIITEQLNECIQEHSNILHELGICPTCNKPINETSSI